MADKSADVLKKWSDLTLFVKYDTFTIEEEGKEPSPSRLQELVREAREADVRVVFIQQEFDTRNAQMMAEETGTKPVVINPLGYDWEKEMINITRALARQTPVE